MSDTISLEVASRDTLGKAVRKLRRSGQVPAVIHDHGKESIHIQSEYQALYKVFLSAGKHHPVELKVDGKKYTALIKNVTFDPRLNTVTHVVFNAIRANQKVSAEIPVQPLYGEGNDASPAERAGLIVLAQAESVEVKALPKDLPNVLEYDAAKLVGVGDQVTVADLVIPEGVEVETEASHVLATVFEPSALAAANDEAGGDAEDESEVAAENGAEEAADTAASDETKPTEEK